MEETTNPSCRSQATRDPKIDKEYEYFVPVKKNVIKTFNRPSFDEMYKRVEKTRCGNIKRDTFGNKVKTNQPRKQGIAIEEFLTKHGFSCHSSPADISHHF